MQNAIEKGMKINPIGTLVAVLACMLVFYLCNFILMKFSKYQERIASKEGKQRVQDVKTDGQGVIEGETAEQERIEDLKATEKDVDKMRREKARTRTTIETKQLPVLIKT